jgi:steroid delta-isomerase-like uncharacterized protein
MTKSLQLVLLGLVLVFLSSCSPGESGGSVAVSNEASKELVHRWIIGVWDNGNRGLYAELTTEDYVYSYPGSDDLREEAFFAFGDSVRTAIPDLNNTIEQQYVEGDTVITRGTTRGTNLGPFGDIPPTGNSIEVPWVMITRLRDGRIAEEWEIFDTFAFMTQIGAVSTSE